MDNMLDFPLRQLAICELYAIPTPHTYFIFCACDDTSGRCAMSVSNNCRLVGVLRLKIIRVF